MPQARLGKIRRRLRRERGRPTDWLYGEPDELACDLADRQYMIDAARGDGRAWHAERRRAGAVLRDYRAAPQLHRLRALADTRVTARQDDGNQAPIERLRCRFEEQVDRRMPAPTILREANGAIGSDGHLALRRSQVNSARSHH